MNLRYCEGDTFMLDGEEYEIANIDRGDEEYPYECYPVEIVKEAKMIAEENDDSYVAVLDDRFIDYRECYSDFNVENYSHLSTKRELEKLKSQLEKAILPPCNVGDVVYPLNADRRFRAFVERIEITNKGLSFEWVQYDVGVDCVECWDAEIFTIEDIGKTVFLDEVEYLKALKEGENDV